MNNYQTIHIRQVNNCGNAGECVMKQYKELMKKGAKHTKVFLKWSVISVLIGIIVGAASTVFSKCMELATGFREDNGIIFYFLPLAGLFIVWCYRRLKVYEDRGTDLILTSLQRNDNVPIKTAPLIFIATVLTHLFGGSAGREGAALQLGGSLGNGIGKLIKLDDNDRKVIIMCGMSAAFSAMFGTPMAAALFSIEVSTIGVMYYTALLPCIFAALVAVHFAGSMGIHPEAFLVEGIPSQSIMSYGKIVVLSILCAVLSIVFCVILHECKNHMKKWFKNPYIRVVSASLIIIALTLIIGTRDYLGAGIPVVERALEGDVSYLAFFWKMIFTAITLSSGFKGGEIVPTLFIGATFGSLLSGVLGLSPSLCGAVGMTALFCGVTNCPIASMLISFELFGFEGMPYYLVAVAISYALSGYIGLYHDQVFAHSKYKIVDFKSEKD